jgi:GT2 family glycosyltransferase
MLDEMQNDPRSGMCCPRLYRADRKLVPVEPKRFDSTGMFITPAIRHFDRGSEELDSGQYRHSEYVFGASGAAVLMRAEFIKDSALSCSEDKHYELFDDAFFAYREDADLSWRAQWLGWKCRYVPEAIGYHKRAVLPERRAALPKELNAYSVRNRFLLQLNNYSFRNNTLGILSAVYRNLLVIFGVLLKERSSISALRAAIQLSPRALQNRARIMRKRRVDSHALAKWFSNTPYSEPALSAPEEENKPLKSVCAIVVNYNSGRRLGSCLRNLSLARVDLLNEIALEVRVIDNASEDSSGEDIASMFTGVRGFSISLEDKNLGFAGAINKAAKQTSAEALLVLNPDTLIHANAIRALTSELTKHSPLGAIAPLLTSHDGELQRSYSLRRFPTIGTALVELFGLHRIAPNNSWTKKLYMHDDPLIDDYLRCAESDVGIPAENIDAPLLVDQPAAACLLIRKSAFDRVGGFSEQYWPAWFEDVDFCKRLRADAYLTAITNRATVLHEGGYSTDTLKEGSFQRIWYRNLLCFWKLHGTPREYLVMRGAVPAALCLRALLLFGASVRNRFKSKSSHQKPREQGITLFKIAMNPWGK